MITIDEILRKINTMTRQELDLLNNGIYKRRIELKASTFHEPPSYSYSFPIEEFIESVDNGLIISDDGYGYYGKNGKESELKVDVDFIEEDGYVGKYGFDSVIWYNR